jgi:hypothetical protein
MGIRMSSFLEKKRVPGSKIVFKNWDKCFREWQIEDILSSALDSNFKLLASKGNTPFALGVFVEVLSKLHLTHVPLAIGDIGPELKHQGDRGMYGKTKAIIFLSVSVLLYLMGLFAWPEGTADLAQSGKWNPGIGLGKDRRRNRKCLFER